MLCGVSAAWATDPFSHPLRGRQVQAGPRCAEGFVATQRGGVPALTPVGVFLVVAVLCPGG